MDTRKLLFIVLALFFVDSFLHLFGWLGWGQLPYLILLLSRIGFIITLGVYAWRIKGLTAYILLCMFLGIELAEFAPELAKQSKVFSDIFLRLIKTIIAPLLFSTLVVGIAGHSDLKQVGRMGIKAIIYFEVVTTLALIIGLIAINVSQAGVGSKIKPQTEQVEKANVLLQQKQSHHVILDIFPENIAKSVAENQILQIVVFSILFAIALAQLKGNHKDAMVRGIEGLAEVMFKFTKLIMYLAPLAVGGAIAYAIASMGYGILTDLFKLLGTLYVALVVFVFIVLLPIALMVKLPFKAFFKQVSQPLSIAFATASSEAALPSAMENLEKMGIPRKVVSFVLPTGFSFNLDGTTLYLSLASVFVAQVCGVNLTLWQQVSMCLILMLTSKGVAGVRGASFLILVSTVSSLGLDPQVAFAILAIDAFMDMGRTSVNLLGNCLATYVIAKWEGEV